MIAVVMGAPAPADPLEGVSAEALYEAANLLRMGLWAETYAMCFEAGMPSISAPWRRHLPCTPAEYTWVAGLADDFYTVLIAAQAAR